MTVRRLWTSAEMALLVGGLVACGGRGGESGARDELKGPAEQGAAVVAEVGAQAIGSDDVRELVSASDVSPRQALEDLVVERLLAAEAHRRGYGERASVARAAREASVHALLAVDVEAVESAASLPADRVEARLDEAVEKHTVPERRRADHVLFRADAKASDAMQALAREGAQAALGELAQGDVDTVLDRYRGTGSFEGVPIVVESLPPIARSAHMEAPFLDALFAAKQPGPLGEVVHTSYGFHAIVLREILPKQTPSRAELEPEVRAALLTERRHERFEALVERLQKQADVSYQDEAIARAFADPPPADTP